MTQNKRIILKILEFTEIRQTDGRAYYHLRTKKSLYQINTPLVSMKATGAGLFRVDSGDQTQVSVFKGKVKVEGDGESVDLKRDQALTVSEKGEALDVRGLPRSDDFDRWNDEREASDAFMLGSLLFFLLSATPMQPLLRAEIPDAQ